VQGIARNPAGVTLILGGLDGESYVISASKECDLQSGSQVCALITLGENCTVSLSDLRLVGAASLSAVLERERKDAELRQKAQVRKQASAKVLTSVKPYDVHYDRGDTQSSRGMTGESLFAAYRKAVAKFNPKLSASDKTPDQ
jgi:hypothetical protein